MLFYYIIIEESDEPDINLPSFKTDKQNIELVWWFNIWIGFFNNILYSFKLLLLFKLLFLFISVILLFVLLFNFCSNNFIFSFNSDIILSFSLIIFS